MTPDPLTALGQADPPPPAVLDAAREALWSAVAREMLTTDPSQASAPRPHRAAEPRATRPRSAPPP